MISTILACFKIKASHKKVKVEQTKVVYKYELPKKKPTCKTVKKKVRFVDSEPTILGEENNEEVEKRRCNSNDGLVEKEGIRVTIRLTKQQAVELLSKCNGSVVELKDVARELLSVQGK
ncbi:unnamed protein product [Vicia faba]|uniref:DUF7890 domain-containing protein n=1 Tax=Vicia faba TaxID=3906 RepID=A0AAV1BF36_VICFA|nr:unnamed protein product [Vicia faba]